MNIRKDRPSLYLKYASSFFVWALPLCCSTWNFWLLSLFVRIAKTWWLIWHMPTMFIYRWIFKSWKLMLLLMLIECEWLWLTVSNIIILLLMLMHTYSFLLYWPSLLNLNILSIYACVCSCLCTPSRWLIVYTSLF